MKFLTEKLTVYIWGFLVCFAVGDLYQNRYVNGAPWGPWGPWGLWAPWAPEGPMGPMGPKGPMGPWGPVYVAFTERCWGKGTNEKHPYIEATTQQNSSILSNCFGRGVPKSMFVQSGSISESWTRKYHKALRNFETNPKEPIPGSETLIFRKNN